MRLDDIQQAVRDAAGQGARLDISGAGSKAHLGNQAPEDTRPLGVASYKGVIEYYPEELMVRVRAGTGIGSLVDILAEQNQILAFDPPDHGGVATIGGVVSAGLSGSRRPFAGSARDFLLGVGLVMADGEYNEFGGQVMKNVAGYDVSRLVCGAFGTLGIIADISLKVLPKPEVEQSVSLSMPIDAARALVSDITSAITPLSGCCYTTEDERLLLRFSGAETEVGRALKSTGGDVLDGAVWTDIDRQIVGGAGSMQKPWGELWRLSTDPLAPVEGRYAWLDWCFGQRWLVNPDTDPRESYKGAGHWTRYAREGFGEAFSNPGPGLLRLHRRLKQAFDPDGIFNPGRMYAGI